MKICDMHCHASVTGQVTRLADADNLAQVIERCGFEKACVQTILLRDPNNLLRNVLSLLLKAEHPGKIYSFGGVFYPQDGGEPDFVRQAQALIAAGFDGIKLFGKPTARLILDLPFDAPAYDALFAYAQRENVPILFHIGDPAVFWDAARCSPKAKELGWFYGEGGYPALETLYEEVLRFMRRFPRLRILFPHMYFMADSLPRISALLDEFPHMRTDLTPGGEMYIAFQEDLEKSRAFFVKYADRILFGTDNAGHAGQPEDNIRRSLEKVAFMRAFLTTAGPCQMGEHTLGGVSLDSGTAEKICTGNFYRFVGECRPLNAEKVLALCESHKEAAQGAANFADFDPALARIRAALGC